MARKTIIATIPGASDKICRNRPKTSINYDISRLNYDWMNAFKDPEDPTSYVDFIKSIFYDHGVFNKLEYIFISADKDTLMDLAAEGIPFTVVIPRSKQSATIQLCENRIPDELLIETIENLEDIVGHLTGMNICRSDIPIEILVDDDEFRARYILK